MIENCIKYIIINNRLQNSKRNYKPEAMLNSKWKAQGNGVP